MSRLGGRPDRIVEGLGVLALAAALALLLAGSYSLLPLSDPARWYGFGRDFVASFASEELAYGFPLLVALAIEVVGPYRAFLVNIPVLVALLVLVYAFARACLPRDGGLDGPLAAFAAATAAGLFVHWNAPLLLRLANPYRDPLSYAWMLGAALGLLVLSRGTPRPSRVAAAAGACLALAGSTRETSVLVAPSLLLLAAVARLRNPALPFWRPLAIFVAAFVLLSVPYLIQNQLVSGNALLPAQAVTTYEDHGLLTPGVRIDHLAATAPAVAAYLRDHWGPLGAVLGVLGLVGAALHRQLGLLALCAPALLTYGAFYAGYERVVERYLLVLDLFAAPLAGAGAAWTLGLALRRLGAGPMLARLAVGAAFAAAVGATFAARPDGAARIRLEDAQRFIRHVTTLLPAEATLLGKRPSIDILKCFLDHRALPLRYLVSSRALTDPGLPERLRNFASAEDPLYFLSGSDSARAFVLGEFDLVETLSLDPVEYGLQRWVGNEPIHLSRVVPWTRFQTSVSVPVEELGDYVLSIDVGSLSKLPRRFARVFWEGRLLDEKPIDGRNYYRVQARRPTDAASVLLRSDRPVPSHLKATLRPLEKAVVLDLEGDRLIPVAARLSDSFRERPKLTRPSITLAGTLDVPTLDPQGTAFVVLADAALSTDGQPFRRTVTVRANGYTVYRGQVESEGQEAGWGALPISFALAEPIVTGPTTRLRWRLLEDEADEGRLFALGEVRVRRHPTVRSVRIDFGTTELPRGVFTGLHDLLEGEAGDPPRWRWTEDRASVRLFLAPDPRAARLELVYRTGARPRGAPEADPRFTWNGRPLLGERRTSSTNGMVRVIETITIPASWMRQVVNLVEVRAVPWVPLEAGISIDSRRLGVMWESLDLERSGLDSRRAP